MILGMGEEVQRGSRLEISETAAAISVTPVGSMA